MNLHKVWLLGQHRFGLNWDRFGRRFVKGSRHRNWWGRIERISLDWGRQSKVSCNYDRMCLWRDCHRIPSYIVPDIFQFENLQNIHLDMSTHTFELYSMRNMEDYID